MNGNPVAPNGAQGAMDGPPCGNQQCGHREGLLRAFNQGLQNQIITLNTQTAQLNGQINQLRAQVAELIAKAQPAPKHHEIVR